MIKTSIAVIVAALGLMVGTALIAAHSGPPATAQSNSDAQMSMERLPPFVIKPNPSKRNGLSHRTIVDFAASIAVSQTTAPANPPAVVAPTAAPPVQPVAATAPATPAVAPNEPPQFLSTDLTANHTKDTGGFLNFLRSVIRVVVGFLAHAEDNIWVIMFGVAGILFLTTGFWQFHAISEERQNKKETDQCGGSYGTSGSCKTKGPCH